MIAYKLFRRDKDGNLHPMFVGRQETTPLNVWLKAKIGQITTDGNHVKSKLGNLALRPGWHCCEIPFADHIGKRQPDGSLWQSADTVWAEVEIPDNEITQAVREANPKTKDSKILLDEGIPVSALELAKSGQSPAIDVRIDHLVSIGHGGN